MKVLFVSNQFPSHKFPYKGSFIYTQAKEIQKQLQKLIVLAPNYGHEAKKSEYKEVKTYRFRTFTKPASDPLLRNLFRGFNGMFALLLFVIMQILTIIQIVRKEKIDLIHAHWILPSGFSSFIASIITKKRLVITTNGSDLTFCGTNSLLRIFVCFLLERIPILICVSNQLQNIANHLCNKDVRSKTIYIGIPKEVITQQKSSKKTVKSSNKLTNIIFVGSLYPIKGIQYLLQSVLLLSSNRQDFFLEIIGSGENLVDYQSFIKKNRLEKYIKIHGFKSHKEVIEMIRRADIAVQTSISEGLSVFIQESVFLGKAIVATNVGGTHEIVIDDFNGYLVEPKNHQQLAEKIDILLSNRDKIELFSKNSLKIADNKLSLEDNMKKVVDIYKEILND